MDPRDEEVVEDLNHIVMEIDEPPPPLVETIKAKIDLEQVDVIVKGWRLK